jgi:hypothetical protein
MTKDKFKTKEVYAISLDEVPTVFNDDCMNELARDGKLPADADLVRFKTGVLGSVRDYVQAVREPSSNQLHQEINALCVAAFREKYDKLAALLESMFPATRAWLEARSKQPFWRSVCGEIIDVKVPTAGSLRDPARRAEACDSALRLCAIGGEFVEGRRRPAGKRSRKTYRPIPYAPQPSPHLPKRDPELDLVTNLKIIWGQATGRTPPLTANHRTPGPFARMAEKVLRLARARGDAVALINELNKRRRELERLNPKRVPVGRC